jgi:hypothetical protein
MQRTCSVEGCERPFHAIDYCVAHYKRWSRHGSPRSEHPINSIWHFDWRPQLEPMPCGLNSRDRECVRAMSTATEVSNAAHMAAWWAADARIQAANAAWDTLELAAD